MNLVVNKIESSQDEMLVCVIWVLFISNQRQHLLENPLHNFMQICGWRGSYYQVVIFDFLLGSICFGIALLRALVKNESSRSISVRT